MVIMRCAVMRSVLRHFVASDRGSLTVASLGGSITLIFLSLMGVVVGQIAWTRVNVSSTADLVALAAVTQGCESGEGIAQRNNARMVSCEWSGNAVTVEVVKEWDGLAIATLGVPRGVRGFATATLTPSVQ